MAPRLHSKTLGCANVHPTPINIGIQLLINYIQIINLKSVFGITGTKFRLAGRFKCVKPIPIVLEGCPWGQTSALENKGDPHILRIGHINNINGRFGHFEPK